MTSKFVTQIKQTVAEWGKASSFLGEVVHDYGVVDEERRGGRWYRLSLITCRKKGKLYLAVKTSWFAYLSTGFRYEFIPVTSASKVREALDDLEALARNK